MYESGNRKTDFYLLGGACSTIKKSRAWKSMPKNGDSFWFAPMPAHASLSNPNGRVVAAGANTCGLCQGSSVLSCPAISAKGGVPCYQPITQSLARHERPGVHSGNLRQRLEETSSGDEIQDLARTLNPMLDRVEISFKQMIQFTADASHELRTPLTVIRGNLELVLRNGAAMNSSARTAEVQETLRIPSRVRRALQYVSGVEEFLLTRLGRSTVHEVFDLTECLLPNADQMNWLRKHATNLNGLSPQYKFRETVRLRGSAE